MSGRASIAASGMSSGTRRTTGSPPETRADPFGDQLRHPVDVSIRAVVDELRTPSTALLVLQMGDSGCHERGENLVENARLAGINGRDRITEVPTPAPILARIPEWMHARVNPSPLPLPAGTQPEPSARTAETAVWKKPPLRSPERIWPHRGHTESVRAPLPVRKRLISIASETGDAANQTVSPIGRGELRTDRQLIQLASTS